MVSTNMASGDICMFSVERVSEEEGHITIKKKLETNIDGEHRGANKETSARPNKNENRKTNNKTINIIMIERRRNEDANKRSACRTNDRKYG